MCSKKNKLNFPKNYEWIKEKKVLEIRPVSFCEDVGVKFNPSYSETKGAFGERAKRTLKNLFYRYLEENDTLSYIKDLQMLTDFMDSRINRSMGLAPNDVVIAEFLTVMYKRMKPRKITKLKFQAGDKDRLVLVEHNFRKEYKHHYTHEIFLIQKINTLVPVPTFFVVDKKGKNIDGIFYDQELSLIK